jgi:RNA polymerase sigma factor (sigma-70 family)
MAGSLGHDFAHIQCWTSPRLGELADAALLERFVQRHDESAFTALVARHGSMVLRSCRRILGNAPEVEDAFQATFLILARKAHTLKQPDALAGWLHGVACRVAHKARTKAAAAAGLKPLPEALLDDGSDPLAQVTARELLTVLDEEVARLPIAQRSAVLLCCLEGHTQEEAAHQLGWTAGSLKGHLERGRRRLQDRLRRRGIALAAALALVSVSRGEAASALLIRSTVTTALGGGIGSSASLLAHRVLQAMFLSKLAGISAVLLALTLAASTTLALVYRGPAAEAPEDKTPSALAAKATDAAKPAVRTDTLGDPLPKGAIARLGTVRLRHGDNIMMVRFTPDGKHLVSQGGDGVRVWDAVSGKELRHLPALGGGSDVSPDGKCIAGVNPGSGPLELWDVESGKKIAALGEKCYAPIRFSPDGKILATLSTDNTVEIWQVETKKKLRSWKVPAKNVGSLAFSPDSRQLFSNGFFDIVRVWDVATGRELHDFLPLAAASSTISLPLPPAISPDGKLVALLEGNAKQTSPAGKSEWKTRISLRDLKSQKLVRELICPTYEISGEPLPFRDLTFGPDGKSLLASGPDRSIIVWNVETGKELRRIGVEELPGSVTLSPDGKKLAVVMAFGSAIRILDLESGQATTPAVGYLMSIPMAALTPDGRTAVTGSPLGPVFVWDAVTGRLRRRLENPHQYLDTLQLGGEGQTLFTSGWDKTVRVWDVATGTERRRLTLERDHTQQKAEEIANRWLVLAPDGKTLAAMDAGKTIHILDAASGTERQHFQGPEKLLGMGWTPDGRSLIVWSGDLKVRVWDTATGRKLREFSFAQDSGDESTSNDQYHCRFALSHDVRLLAIGVTIENGRLGDLTSSVILKDLTTGQVVHCIGGLPAWCACVAFSPDDRMLAWASTNSYDSAIRLFETASGRERYRLDGHRGRITALTFSADGRRLLSGCSDTTALVWDLSANSPFPVNAADMEALWKDLATTDAARAYRAIHRLAVSHSLAIPWMRDRMRPVAVVDEKRLARLLADLDSDDFATRERTTAELEKLGERTLPAYRKALLAKPSLESRRRLEDLLEKAHAAYWDVSGERLRSLRAIEALELDGTTEAREPLATLAAGAEGARLTDEAKAALERLERKK